MDRLSISSERPEEVEADEEEGTVSSPAASPESHVSDRLIWINGQPCLVPVTCDIATEHPEASLECPWLMQWEEEEEKEKEKEEKEEENETTDPMPTLGSSQLQCRGCNSTLAESDLSSWDDSNQSPRRAGLSRLAETEDAPACAACLNHWSL